MTPHDVRLYLALARKLTGEGRGRPDLGLPRSPEFIGSTPQGRVRIAIFHPPPDGGPVPGDHPGVGTDLEVRLRSGIAADSRLAHASLAWIRDSSALARDAAGVDSLLVLLDRTPLHPPRWEGAVPPGVPVVVAVAGNPAATALALRHLRIDEIVTVAEPDSDLCLALERAAAHSVFGRAMVLVRNCDYFSETLRRWLLEVLTAYPPYASVAATFRSIGLGPAAIGKRWRTEIGRSSPKKLLRWIRLARAVTRKAPAAGWDRVAAEIRVDRRTLERNARQLTGLTLEELAADDGLGLREHFHTYLRRILLGG